MGGGRGRSGWATAGSRGGFWSELDRELRTDPVPWDEDELAALHRRLEDELRGEVRDSALVSLRRIVARAAPTPGDVSVLHAVLGALVKGR